MPINPSKRTFACIGGVSRLEALSCVALVSVLLALSLPRFAELNDNLRPMRLKAAMAAVQAAASLFHARCESVLAGGSQNDCVSVMVDGAPVAGWQEWPAASADGIARVAALAVDDTADSNGFALRRGKVGGAPALFIGWQNRRCEFSYVQAMSPGGVPQVDIVDNTCL